jgi:hypothetical protein
MEKSVSVVGGRERMESMWFKIESWKAVQRKERKEKTELKRKNKKGSIKLSYLAIPWKSIQTNV